MVHIVTADGVKPNLKKIKAVKYFPTWNIQKEVKRFFGLVGYNRFIKDFAKILKPLTQLLKRDVKFDSDENCKNLFKL